MVDQERIKRLLSNATERLDEGQFADAVRLFQTALEMIPDSSTKNQRARERIQQQIESCKSVAEAKEDDAFEGVLSVVSAQQETAKGQVSTGRYEYRMVQRATDVTVEQDHGREAARYWEQIANQMALDGWDFYRVDTVNVIVPAGCLAVLMGQASQSHKTYFVLTFRRLRNMSIPPVSP